MSFSQFSWKKKSSFRSLGLESLESRELMSATLADLPRPDFETSQSALVSQEQAGERESRTDASDEVGGRESGVPIRPLADEIVSLAPPKATRPAYVATPTTLQINWAAPVPSRTQNTNRITHFEVKLLHAQTKQVVAIQTVASSEYTALFEGLDVKTRYQAVVTSCGGAGTSNDRAERKISATTAAFPAATIRASQITLTSATLTITDRDRVTAFVDGRTVKTYAIQYIEKPTGTPSWIASTITTLPAVDAGTAVTDAKKYAIVTEVTGLQPGKNYLFRVVSTYTDGTTNTTDLSVEGRAVSMRTLKLPAVSVSKSHFSVIDQTDYKFAVGLTGKVANYTKLGSGISISFSVLVSTGTKVDRTTGLLEGAKPIADNGFSAINAKGEFTMNGVSLESIVSALGRDAVLGSKTLSFQLVATFSFDDGVTATLNSKSGKATMPAWYQPA